MTGDNQRDRVGRVSPPDGAKRGGSPERPGDIAVGAQLTIWYEIDQTEHLLLEGGQHAPLDRKLETPSLAGQILADLGVKKMRVIGTPTKLTGVSGFGLELAGYLEE